MLLNYNTAKNHNFWMSYALELAEKEKNEVPVCALIVKENTLIASAINTTETSLDATSHAEVLVIRKASEALSSWRLEECIMYVTLEPCSMCAGAIINSRISKLIFGAYDTNSGACGSKINLFHDLAKSKNIEIIGGIHELRSAFLLKKFFRKSC